MPVRSRCRDGPGSQLPSPAVSDGEEAGVRTRSGTSRRPRTTRSRAGGLVVALALAAAACGVDDGDDDLGARLDEVEQERDEAEERAASLAEENERLEEELDELRAELDRDPDDEEPPAPEPLRTPEGLVDPLRLHLPRDDLPEGHEPATTAWSPFDLPDELEQTHPSPGRAAGSLLAALEADGLGQDVWEATARVLLDPEDQDTAHAAVLSWGWADDAVEGRDVRVTLTRTEEGQWRLGDAQVRQHCRRGVADEQRCV